jgi:chemotaxis protein histidine kinase CheA
MAYDQLRNAIDGIRSKLQAELEAQLTILERHQQEAIDAARRAADVEAHERSMVQLEQVRADWASRLETELAAAAADADRRTVAECTRARLETEQAAAESIAQVRAQADASAQERVEALERERDAERTRAEAFETELAQIRTQLETAAAEAADSSGSVAEARLSERQSQLAVVERLLDSVRAIGDAQALSDVLSALVAGAAGEVPRVALLVVNGDELQGFRVSGFDEAAASSRVPLNRPGALQDAIASALAVFVPAAAAPEFAGVPDERAGLAVPIVVGNRAVGVLYADDVAEGEPTAPASWPEAVQILCRHASVALGHLTAIRTAQAMHRSAATNPLASALAPAATEDDQAARRYAKLLVSEIKLYNEVAVRIGREKRDLLTRLRPEVERAKRLYEERVPAAVAGRGMYFQQELVHTLADGDPSLLGNSAVPS